MSNWYEQRKNGLTNLVYIKKKIKIEQLKTISFKTKLFNNLNGDITTIIKLLFVILIFSNKRTFSARPNCLGGIAKNKILRNF